MRIDILTIFPQFIEAGLDFSVVGRARRNGFVEITTVDLRDYTDDRHRSVDDTPYGGEHGMVMRIEPIARALHHIGASRENARIVLTSPLGKGFSQTVAQDLAGSEWLVLICGHYEGVDERVRQHLVTDEISIGDYVLTGGELPALVITDAIMRLLPGVLGNQVSASDESFTAGMLEYPQYTRPRIFNGWTVPEILLSGNHAAIARWRRYHQLVRTRMLRSDLFEELNLSEEDRKLLAEGEPLSPVSDKN
ncbi:MAG: tRNA (guanosine(37)-N1)-methyltransferase TrmD [Armatimonadetes bacterium]|nr:tRNA (guanosine(37)-N1)-methyltransferase TrmD [Armatimonadota bacterium]